MWIFWLILGLVVACWFLLGVKSLILEPLKSLWRKVIRGEDVFPEDKIFNKWKQEHPNGHINEYWASRSNRD